MKIKENIPYNIEAEQSVLGSMITNKEAIAIASNIITNDDFYQKQYGIIFKIIVDLYNENKPIDLIILQNKMKELNITPEIANIKFIGKLLSIVPTSINVKYYAEIVYKKSILRKLINIAEEIIHICYSDNKKIQEILEIIEKKIFNLINNNNNNKITSIKNIILNVIDKIEKASKNKNNITGLSTGFIDLDYKTSGFQKSDLILIAARPSMGKTAFILNIIQYMILKINTSVLIFSMEMSKEQLVNRMLSLKSKINSNNIRTGNLNSKEWNRLIKSANMISSSDIVIDDTPSISISELRTKCRKYKIEKKIDIIFIDYIQLMSSNNKYESRQQEISYISKSLKLLARELNIPIVALSQLSRAVEQRPDHRPILSDLRESGAMEQDADVIIFIYRDDYYNKDSNNRNIAQIIIAKQRNGPTGIIDLLWIPDYTQFANLEK